MRVRDSLPIPLQIRSAISCIACVESEARAIASGKTGASPYHQSILIDHSTTTILIGSAERVSVLTFSSAYWAIS